MPKTTGILIDLSGTIHIGDKLIGKSKEAIQKLNNAQLPYMFVSNTTKESKNSLHTRLNKLGLNIPKEKIFTSLTATYDYLARNSLRPYSLLSKDALLDFEDLPKEDPNCVVIGLAPEMFSYEEMNKAFQHVLNGCQIIAAHKARYYPAKDEVLRLGPGPFVSALEYACSKEAKVIGKPSPNFFQSALDILGNPDVSYMIGDCAKDDIEGSQRMGIHGILVKTGKYQTGDEDSSEKKPHFVAEDFSEAVEFILNQKM
ncbi:haloacid dehalogenase-like hydrolase domain-containing protein 2 [Clytia hemisphaerica]|uniref:Haloacid dehalogenase-like hydrolase domain-containing protein 2 n=1 Tax=Clytia hemisphaerica TaxID=252671 RepID=A0A7M5V4Y4_9CNID